MSIHLIKVQFVNSYIDYANRKNRGYGKKYEICVFQDGLSFKLIKKYGVISLSKNFSNTEIETYDLEDAVLKETGKIISRKRLKKKGYEKAYAIWHFSGPWIEDGKIRLDGFEKTTDSLYEREFEP